MPSPELAGGFNSLDQSSVGSQSGMQNGSGASDMGPGGVDSLDNGTTQPINGPSSNFISEGKQNAQAKMVVSGGESANEPNGTHQSNGTNGSAQSRKRSRDGSVIQSSDISGTLTVRTRETPVDKILLDQYVNREFQYSAAVAWENPAQELQQQKRSERDFYLAVRRETQGNPAALFGVGYEGFGNPRSDLRNQPPQLLYPAHRRRPGNRKTRELRVSRRDMKIQNEQIEDLVPIRLDIDWEKIKIRDTFTWNLHDRVVSPDLFAEKLVEDLGLSLETSAPLMRMISQSIQEQIMDYYPQIYMQEEPLDPQQPYTAHRNDEMRILIKLNITIGQHTLIDQFEWDINDPQNSPEEFALRLTDDLSLSGEFTTAIAHSIREQSQLFTKSLYIVSHPFDGRPIEDPDLSTSFLPTPVASAFRPFQAAKEHTPYLYELNEADLERTEISISREQRRQKRSINRRGGPALPDLKDRQRTIRTLIVSSVIPNSAQSFEESNVIKRSGSSRRRGLAGTRGDDESDDFESDDSDEGSPAIGPHLSQGTARTRGMRGAATAAHAALRASLGQSATPEPIMQEPTRASSRRQQQLREESLEEPDKLVVKLKIPRDKLADLRSGKRIFDPSTQAGAMAPPSDKQNRHHHPPRPQQTGAVDAPNPPQQGVPGPPPPSWLQAGLTKLKQSHPNDSFEGVMRYSAVDTETLAPVSNPTNLQAGQKIKYQYLPRIRCHDCPGKLYTPGPGMTVDNFEVHLRNRQHKERVEERINKTGSLPVTPDMGGSAGASPAPGAATSACASPALGASPSHATGPQP
ncbi:SWI/SNF chromatin-remodeling complex subunit snf5 [Penicillium cataractarum]|uniref:SWI/SNF chromatin-remodeling complex subunit snf5 n=1 Tax=Penicillium cataractarum TaxID=2100454 RepID=A0A9W9S7X2_9EURO|nr:SWI/SNF chromatin-remodeling complex subunit snf5 [Penicillium cataractarum]KAJ5371248.1 SWI/SNF chromatin-remodeling complex subunit snf5 [Penicillium cataractarum]